MIKLLKKIWVQIFGALHDVVDEHSDVGITARQGVRQIEKQISLAEESITNVDAELRLMRKSQKTAMEEAMKWGKLAQAAANNGNREEAMGAINKQVLAEERADKYGKNSKEIEQSFLLLSNQLEDLRMEKSKRDSQASLLGARSRVAKVKSQAARTLGNVGVNSGINMDELNDKVDRQEAKAAALTDMATARVGTNPEMRLEEIGRRDSIAAKAAALGLIANDTLAIKIEGNKDE